MELHKPIADKTIRTHKMRVLNVRLKQFSHRNVIDLEFLRFQLKQACYNYRNQLWTLRRFPVDFEGNKQKQFYSDPAFFANWEEQWESIPLFDEEQSDQEYFVRQNNWEDNNVLLDEEGNPQKFPFLLIDFVDKFVIQNKVCKFKTAFTLGNISILPDGMVFVLFFVLCLSLSLVYK